MGSIYPQAQDGAITVSDVSGLTLAGSVFMYVFYKIYQDLCKPWPRLSDAAEVEFSDRRTDNQPSLIQIVPHAEQSTPSDMTKAQNVTFMDTHPGFAQDVLTTFDEIRDAPLAGDSSLEQFFSRPIRISTIEWPVSALGGLLFEKINPWQLYFEDPRVINRIANYKLMRAKLHIKILINGNMFHYGRAIASYNPLPLDDTMTVDREFVDADLVGASQRPHLYLDPTNSQGGEMCFPFFTPSNLLDIPAMGWRNMGELAIHSMQGLKHANGATDKVTINVFAWAEDVKFAIPTQETPGAILPQAEMGGMDEYSKKPVSRIAGAIANMASYLTTAPGIGPYAMATKIGASAIGQIATLFGYSSPVNLDFSHFRSIPTTNYSVTNSLSDAMKLSVDAKQELTVDPRTVGLSGDDELTISHIAKHESWFANFPWAVDTPVETLLFNVVVDPGIHQNFNNEIHLTAPAFAAAPFKYWRGSLRYRFQVVCSGYHKGRLKVVYDPSGNATGEAEYNTAYTTIVDISDTADFSIDVGWGQPTPYRQHFAPNATNAVMFDISPLSYNASTAAVGNGTLAVYVVNELTVPNSTSNNDIEVNVFVSACDDFEVACPNLGIIERLRFTPAVAPPDGINRSGISPQSEEGGMNEETMKQDSQPVDTSPINTVGLKVPIASDPTNTVYFGESIKSMRQLLKRYSRHKPLPSHITDDDADMFTQIYVGTAFPNQVGFNTEPTYPRVNYGINGSSYTYGWTTFLNYLTSAYGGWRGGIRHMADFGEFVSAKPSGFTMSVTREPDATTHQNFLLGRDNDSDTALGLATYINATNNEMPWNGTAWQSVNNNPHLHFELPYQLPWRFSPAKRLSKIRTPDTYDSGYRLSLRGEGGPDMSKSFGFMHVAGAEDFTCFFFLGAPILYDGSAIPSA